MTPTETSIPNPINATSEPSTLNVSQNSLPTDLLTGLLNKTAMSQIITERIPEGGSFFLFHLDDINTIYSTYGQVYGNQILQEFADRLKKLCRESDLIGRISNNQFLIYMSQILTENEIYHIIDRFRQNIQKDISRSELEDSIKKGAGIAVATTREHSFRDFDDILSSLYDSLQNYSGNATSSRNLFNSSKYIFSRVFSSNIEATLSNEELTETMQAMNNVHLANFFIRLSDLSYVILKDSCTNEKIDSSHKNAQQMLFANIRHHVKPEYQEAFLSFADLSTLADRLSQTDSIKLEYQSILLGWCIASFTVIRRENDKAVKVMLLLTKLTDSRAQTQSLLEMQKEAVSLLSSSELLFVSIIQKETGDSHVIQSKHILDINSHYDYQTCMEKEAHFIEPSMQKEFLEKIHLNRILEELKFQEHYTVTSIFVLPNNGRCRRISYHFSNCKTYGQNQYILSATEDTTDLFTQDSITKLKNFDGFKLDCQYEMSQKHPDQFVVMNFNIVNFKAINSIYGYGKGNQILKSVQEKLSDSSLAFLSVCRENADNFFCLCSKENYNFNKIKPLCKFKYQDSNGQEDILELFCGIYVISSNTDSLNAICDKARFARKHAAAEAGINAYVFNEQENTQYIDEAVILSSVPKAIEHEEFVVYYQPIYAAKSGKIHSAEALVRWNHPEKGLLLPGSFIPAIERTGQIAELDLYVGRKVQQLQRNRFILGKRLIPISFNMSRYDFLQQDKMQNTLSMLRSNPEIANYIRVEITESGLINIPNNGEFFIHEMKCMGIKTVIDDFGTGYSSLSSIVDRPCDIIKLDMSFARQIGVKTKMEDLIIGSIETAHRLGITVVAEGVETEEQYNFLRNNDCDYIQGYFFSKPLPKQEFEKLLDT